MSGNFSTGFQRSFRTIEPGAIERIEVVRGPSAIYGDGAAGGVVNIITRRPTEEFTASAEVGTDFSLTHPEDSFGYNVQANAAGTEGNYNYTTHIGWTTTGSYFDAEGDRVPLIDNGAADISTLQILAKAEVDLTAEQSLQLTLNHFDESQGFDYISDPAIEDIDGLQKARALELGGDLEYVGTDDPGNRNTLLNLEYRHDNLLNSQVSAQLYYRDIASRSAFIDLRPFEGSAFPLRRGVQATERFGGRFQVETPVVETASVLWGLDYSSESVFEQLDIFDEDAFDEQTNPVLEKVDEGSRVPEYDVESLGLFVQGQWEATDQIILSGGVRHERYGVSIPSFTSAANFLTLEGTEVIGGERDGSGTVFNTGIVYKVTPEVGIFGTFSQGFSLPDIARLLRRPPAGFNFEEDLDLSEPVKVDNYEIGVRGQWQDVTASLAAFYNYSDLGATVVFDTPGQPGRLSRAPQRNYGIEAAVDWQATDTLAFGSAFTLVEGEDDTDEDDDFTPISTFDIAPLKLTAYVEHETTPEWTNRLQLLYVGDRDRAFDEGVDPVEIEGYLLVDLISSLQLGDGVLSVGIENIFNNQYIPYTAQYIGAFSETLRFAGRGTTLSVNYRMNF